MSEVCPSTNRSLETGETLDEHGVFMTYGEAVNVDEMSARADRSTSALLNLNGPFG